MLITVFRGAAILELFQIKRIWGTARSLKMYQRPTSQVKDCHLAHAKVKITLGQKWEMARLLEEVPRN